MHELSLCRSIFAVVDEAAAGRAVRTVHLQVGQLRQVVPETLVYCWGLVTEGSSLGEAALEIDHVPVRLSCRACGETTEVGHVLVLVCAACTSGDIEMVSGEEFMVTSLDVESADIPAESAEVTQQGGS
ncbi:MAG: hydrogenase maturation nickel metallochaperone HypA [Nocardioides sp.]